MANNSKTPVGEARKTSIQLSQATNDRARRMLPRQRLADAHRGAGAPVLRLVPMLVHVSEEGDEMVGIGIGPGKAFVVRTRADGRNQAVDAQRVAVVGQDAGVAAPVGGDGGEAARHRLEQRQSPPFSSAGGNESGRRPV